MGKGEWSDFFSAATTKDEIALRRPFYPHAPGGKKQADLLYGLGVVTIDDLRRVCERKTQLRQAACSLFWTLGPNQVGKAAIAGWRDLFLPLPNEHRPVRFWPFEGTLDELVREPGLVIAETYPAEFYLHLGLRLTTKRGQEGRRACAQAIFDWATVARVELSPGLRDEIGNGFGPKSDGEDRSMLPSVCVGCSTSSSVDDMPDVTLNQRVRLWRVGSWARATSPPAWKQLHVKLPPNRK